MCASAFSPHRSWKPAMPADKNSQCSVSRVPPSAGSKVNPQRTQPLLTSHANSRPGSATTTRLRVSQVRSGSSLRPVNHAPTRGPSPSSHQQALQTGLHLPMLVTSDTSSYNSSGGTATAIDSDIFKSVTSGVCPSAKLERVLVRRRRANGMSNGNQRSAVVIGGASGIGWATAQALAAQGDRVTVADLNADGAHGRAAALGDPHTSAAVDVTDEDSVQRLFEQTGPIDIVVNCAGFSNVGLITDMPVDQFRDVIDVCLTGAFIVAKHAGRNLRPAASWSRSVRSTAVNPRQA